MAGSADFYRIRVGNNRIICSVQDDIVLVLIAKVGNRGDVYR
jgi:mRNA-degrading endonuclease RelE of RelBE toxin-antitoxin system